MPRNNHADEFWKPETVIEFFEIKSINTLARWCREYGFPEPFRGQSRQVLGWSRSSIMRWLTSTSPTALPPLSRKAKIDQERHKDRPPTSVTAREIYLKLDLTANKLANLERNGQFPRPLYDAGKRGTRRWRISDLNHWLEFPPPCVRQEIRDRLEGVRF